MTDGIISSIGKTPLVRLTKIEREMGLSAKIYAKLEFFNPAGSAKDRAALFMIRDGEKRGALRPGDRIIEATSGNMGVALAMLGARLGYRTAFFMPENASLERVMLMRALGAEIHLTDASGGMAQAVSEARRLAEQGGGFLTSQFESPANKRAHYMTTAPEIYRDLGGVPDVLVAGVGTGGTLSGVGEYLKSKYPAAQIYAVEPAESPTLSASLFGAKSSIFDGTYPVISAQSIHRLTDSQPPKTSGSTVAQTIPGIGAGFVPPLLNSDLICGTVTVSAGQAYHFTRFLAATEGIMAGISSGAALCASLALAGRQENRGKSILTVFPDGAERYFSQEIYAVEK